jgi:hypothetical protein
MKSGFTMCKVVIVMDEVLVADLMMVMVTTLKLIWVEWEAQEGCSVSTCESEGEARRGEK